MKIVFPKNCPSGTRKLSISLAKRIKKGSVVGRKTKKFNYKSYKLNFEKRAVLVGGKLHIFNNHSSYEAFIDKDHF